MKDVSRYLEPRIAPRAIFDTLSERADWVRFRVASGSGEWHDVTWRAFADQIRKVALYIQSEVEPGARIALFATNSVEWMSTAMGIQAAGCVLVPIYSSSTAEQVRYVLEHSDASLVFADAEPLLTKTLAALPACPAIRRVVVFGPTHGASPKAVSWERCLELGRTRDHESPDAFDRVMRGVALEQDALMLYTSGTSGPPKGVPLTHKNLAVNGRDWLTCNALSVEERDVDVLWLPMSHIFGFGEACLGNTLGFTSWLADPSRALAVLPEARPHVFMSVPSLWEKIAVLAQGRAQRLAEVTGGRLRFCLSGGAGLKQTVKEDLLKLGVLVLEGYGLTECSPTLTLNTAAAFRFDSVGKPLPTVEIRLADDGEILARGENVFRGYHKDPEATRSALRADGWFATGDIGRFTDDGFLQIIDRKKDILVTAGGKNVAPANIELRFRDDRAIEHLVVYGDGHRYLVAGVWLRPGVPADVSKVQASIDAVNGELASFETLKRFRIFGTPLTVENGLLTPTLKIRRKDIYARLGPQFEELYT